MHDPDFFLLFSQIWDRDRKLFSTCFENIYPFFVFIQVLLFFVVRSHFAVDDRRSIRLFENRKCRSFLKNLITVLGFGPNLVTIFMIIVLGYKMRGYQESRVRVASVNLFYMSEF